MKVLVQSLARLDMARCAEFWEEHQQGLGSEFLDFMEIEVNRLTTLAGIHRKRGHYYRMLVGGRFPYYSVFYRIEGDTAYVVVIVDTRRDPARIAAILKRRLR